MEPLQTNKNGQANKRTNRVSRLEPSEPPQTPSEPARAVPCAKAAGQSCTGISVEYTLTCMASSANEQAVLRSSVRSIISRAAVAARKCRTRAYDTPEFDARALHDR